MNKEQADSLNRVISYLYVDEKKDYDRLDHPENEPILKNHIFKDIEALSNYVIGRRNELGLIEADKVEKARLMNRCELCKRLGRGSCLHPL